MNRAKRSRTALAAEEIEQARPITGWQSPTYTGTTKACGKCGSVHKTITMRFIGRTKYCPTCYGELSAQH